MNQDKEMSQVSMKQFNGEFEGIEEDQVGLKKRTKDLMISGKFLGNNKDDDDVDDDNRDVEGGISESEIVLDNHDTVWSILKSSLKNEQLRSLMIIYGISSACCNSEALISMMYIQTSWEKGGLAIDSNNLVKLSVLCFFPSVLILLYSDRIIPKKISISKFIKTIIIIFSSFVLLLPFLRDFINHESRTKYLVMAKYLGSNFIHSRCKNDCK